MNTQGNTNEGFYCYYLMSLTASLNALIPYSFSQYVIASRRLRSLTELRSSLCFLLRDIKPNWAWLNSLLETSQNNLNNLTSEGAPVVINSSPLYSIVIVHTGGEVNRIVGHKKPRPCSIQCHYHASRKTGQLCVIATSQHLSMADSIMNVVCHVSC